MSAKHEEAKMALAKFLRENAESSIAIDGKVFLKDALTGEKCTPLEWYIDDGGNLYIEFN